MKRVTIPFAVKPASKLQFRGRVLRTNSTHDPASCLWRDVVQLLDLDQKAWVVFMFVDKLIVSLNELN